MASVKKNYAWNMAFQITRTVIPLILTPYLTRTLGGEGLGIYSYTASIATYFEILAFMGLDQYGTRQIARSAHDMDQLSQTFCSIFAMQLAWGLLVTGAYLIYCFYSASAYSLIAFVWSFWVLGEALDVTWLFFGLEEFKLTTIRSVLIRIISVVCVFMFVRSEADVWIYCLIMALYYFFTSLSLWPFVIKRIKFALPNIRQVIKHIKPSVMLFAPTLAITLYMQLDRILLGVFCDMSEVGYFDQSDKVCQMSLSFITALSSVMLPHISRLLESNNEKSALSAMRNSMMVANFMSFAFCLGIIGVAPIFVPVFFGDGFESCVSIMIALAIEIPLVAWRSSMVYQCLIPKGMDRPYLVSIAAGTVINLVLSIFLIPRLQSIGAAVAMVCTEVVIVAIQVGYLKAQIPFRLFVRDLLPFVFAGILMMFIVRYVGSVTGATVFGLLISIVCGAVSYCILSIICMRAFGGEHLKSMGKGFWLK